MAGSMQEKELIAALRAASCLTGVDRVGGDPDTTAFKRTARLQQAKWREAKGFPIGTQPPKPVQDETSSKLGSRLQYEFALQRPYPNFLNERICQAVDARLGNPEKYEQLWQDRLFCDLLSSMPMCFNLFGTFYSDLEAADRAVKTWWPDAPGRVKQIRFEWSPGRRNPEFLGNQSAFDVAFELDLGNGQLGVIGVETKFHEHAKPEAIPTPQRLDRYLTVAKDSGIFRESAMGLLLGTELQQIWQDHLLALSMLQHSLKKWAWAKFVLVYPKGNPSFRRAAEDYEKCLAEPTGKYSWSTFEHRTLEDLLDAWVLPEDVDAAFRARYLW